MVAPAGLADMAAHADVVGVHKNLVIPRTPAGTLGPPTSLVDDAHAAGLGVHASTFHDEHAFPPVDLRRGPRDADHGHGLAECVAILRAGVDGLFADSPDVAVASPRLLGAASSPEGFA